jgi:hypothetical protein
VFKKPQKKVNFLYVWVGIIVLGLGFAGGLLFNKYTNAASCVSTQNGYWGSTTTWLSCGGDIPQIGDDVDISHAVTTTVAIALINDLAIKSGGVLAQSGTATNTISGTFTIESGGILTHLTNSDDAVAGAHAHEINFVAANIDIQSGGSVDVDYKGHDREEGPGAGLHASGEGASGAGHGGDGGVGDVGVGGSAYCVSSSPFSIGSGGGSHSGAFFYSGGSGGGLIKLNASSTLTLNGTITADGKYGIGQNALSSGGGSGGAINLYGGSIVGSPQSLTATGGSINGAVFDDNSGGGGGGCVFLDYDVSNILVQGDANVSGGLSQDLGVTNTYDGETGTFLGFNNTPTTTSIYPAQETKDYVSVTTTISDIDIKKTNLTIDYSLDGSTWVSSTIGSVTQGGEGDGVTTSTGSISGIDTDNDGSVDITFQWNIGADVPGINDASVYLKITPNDGGTDGDVMSSAAFSVDTLGPTSPGALSINSTSTSFVILNFGATSTDASFAEYKIFYSNTTPVTEADTAHTSSTDVNLGNIDFNDATTTTISSLVTNTLYYANIWGYESWGNTSSSPSEVSFYTLAGTPTGLSNSALATSTASFSVSTFVNDSLGSSGYYFDLTVTDGGAAVSSSAWQSGDNTWSISSLTPNTGYTIESKYRNGDGVETVTTSLGFSTLSNEISSITPTVDSDTQITLSWTGDSTEYRSQNYTISSTTGWSANTSSIWSGLTPNMAYEFLVQGKNILGTTTAWSSTSTEVTFSTVPASASAAADSSSQITISWTAANSSWYQVERTDTSATSSWTQSSSESFSGLSASTEYSFRVKAKNSQGDETAWSSTVSATTNSGNSIPTPGGSSCAGVPNPTGEFTINNGNKYASSTEVYFNFFNLSDDSSNYVVAEENSFDGLSYSTMNDSDNFNFTLSSGEVKKNVYIRLKHDTCNKTSVVSSTIILDETPPIFAGDNVDSLPSVVKDNLVTHIKFNEGYGASTQDSARSNDGIITNAEWLDSALSFSGLNFDGDGYVTIPNTSDINLGLQEQRSISVWFKVEDKDISQKQVIYEEGGQSRGLNMYI